MYDLRFSLIKGQTVCNFTYFGEGVVYQSAYDRANDVAHNMPIYRDDYKDAATFMVHEVSRMLKEGWEIAES
jgi:hypothetical protein